MTPGARIITRTLCGSHPHGGVHAADVTASGITHGDPEHLGRPRVIATALLMGPGGHRVIVDPGPSEHVAGVADAARPAGATVADVTIAILVTYIHPIHAGYSFAGAREPAFAFMHSVGAPHMHRSRQAG